MRSFRYWTELAGVSQFEVRLRNSLMWQSAPEEPSHRMLLFLQGTWEVRLALPESSCNIDFDVKGDLLERVSLALMTRLEELESPSKIPLHSFTSNK